MKDSTPQAVHLRDYQEPNFWIPEVELNFDIYNEKTIVSAKLHCERNETLARSAGILGRERLQNHQPSISLNGEHLTPTRVALNGRVLSAGDYTLTETHLTIANVPDRFLLEITTELDPSENLSCEGLYRSKSKTTSILCTQCEAESFRRITYFLDRPDVMSVFTVTIEAEKKAFPILLSNGNRVSQHDLGNGRHQAVWKDPHKKPCYLFALVAGDMGVVEDRYTTLSGRDVQLQIFAPHGLQASCQHAMDALKWSMKWDEDAYGLEYDLDVYMIVVAEDFNMGAMENKGLNVFNAKHILAQPETATDADFTNIAGIVAHEYFHNWTGNRVTCRDWFQLSLKEGLTVFRDQRFSSDMGSSSVRRIEDVIRLRTMQFAEDAGPMAHPVRPHSYISINNFYTTTIYEKGAEVIRMMETLVGRDGFRKGMDLYFKRHDGRAVRTEDFVAAQADANQIDLTQFKNWYDQTGTPILNVTTSFNRAENTYEIDVEQLKPASYGDAELKPFHIPVTVGLVGPDGYDLPLTLAQDSGVMNKTQAHGHGQPRDHAQTSLVLEVKDVKQKFVFSNVTEKPVLSILRNFSAPVRLSYDYTNEDLAFLLAHDSDAFCRWEAAQTLTVRTIKALVEELHEKRPMSEPHFIIDSFGPVLSNKELDPAFVSFLLSLPSEQYLMQFFPQVDIDALHTAREFLYRSLALKHEDTFVSIFDRLEKKGTDGTTPEAVADRALRSRVLGYLTHLDKPAHLQRALRQMQNAKNMTDELGALEAMLRSRSPLRDQAFSAFYDKWKGDSLVMNKWLTTRALSPLPSAFAEVRHLLSDPVYDKFNPNKIYSLLLAFSKFNLVRFHDRSGEAYRFIADQVIEIDERNPQVAARLMSAFNQWRVFDEPRQLLMKAEISRILNKQGLSSNVFEIAQKTLA